MIKNTETLLKMRVGVVALILLISTEAGAVCSDESPFANNLEAICKSITQEPEMKAACDRVPVEARIGCAVPPGRWDSIPWKREAIAIWNGIYNSVAFVGSTGLWIWRNFFPDSYNKTNYKYEMIAAAMMNQPLPAEPPTAPKFQVSDAAVPSPDTLRKIFAGLTPEEYRDLKEGIKLVLWNQLLEIGCMKPEAVNAMIIQLVVEMTFPPAAFLQFIKAAKGAKTAAQIYGRMGLYAKNLDDAVNKTAIAMKFERRAHSPNVATSSLPKTEKPLEIGSKIEPSAPTTRNNLRYRRSDNANIIGEDKYLESIAKAEARFAEQLKRDLASGKDLSAEQWAAHYRSRHITARDGDYRGRELPSGKMRDELSDYDPTDHVRPPARVTTIRDLELKDWGMNNMPAQMLPEMRRLAAIRYNEVLADLRQYIRSQKSSASATQLTSAREKLLISLSDYLHTVVKSQFFPQSNFSLVMTEINSVLEEVGLKVIGPHNSLDWRALREDYKTFRDVFRRAVEEGKGPDAW
jgi:hypothetical protein